MQCKLLSTPMATTAIGVLCLTLSATGLLSQTNAPPSTRLGGLSARLSSDPSPGILSPAGYEAWRTILRHTLRIPSALSNLQAQSLNSFSPTADVRAERIRYTADRGMRVSAVLYLPQNATAPLPGIVIVNGAGDGKSSWYDSYAGLLYAKAGAAVLTYDPVDLIQHNKKAIPQKHARPTSSTAPETAIQTGSMMVVSVLQAVNYLRQRREVDPHRIAVLGYAEGSLTSLLASALDSQISALVLAGGGDFDGPGGYWETSRPGDLGQTYTSLRLIGQPYADRAAMIYALHAEYGPTLVINGTHDSMVSAWHHGPAFFSPLEQQVSSLNGTQNHPFNVIFLPDTGHSPSFLSKDAVLWLNHQLHFANWTENFIRKLPEMQVSQWMQSYRLPFHKMSADWQSAGTLKVPNLNTRPLPPKELDGASGTTLAAIRR
ncbi:MAG: alpha/beta hydrolase [Acidobacteriaceae bacterium]